MSTVVSNSGPVNESSPATMNVMATDTDVDGDNHSVSSFTQPSNGQVTKKPDGTLKYTPDENDPALQCDLTQCPDVHDLFHYTVSDGNGGTDKGTVDVMVYAP